jgi:hypothetical protein
MTAGTYAAAPKAVVHTQKKMMALMLVTASGRTTLAINQNVEPMMTVWITHGNTCWPVNERGA